jgi:hypothetical protein
MLEDRLSVIWFERRVRLWERVRQFCADRGITGPTRKIPLNIGVPLLQSATLEEDDDLQDIWARLFVNSADAGSGIEPRAAYGAVLAEMSLLDVRNLSQIEKVIQALSVVDVELHKVWTYRLPESGITLHMVDPHISNTGPSPAVLVSLSNLDRLGCVRSVKPPGGGGYDLVTLTPFGGASIMACTR